MTYVFDGRHESVHSPKQANALGIEVVYQDLALCDNLDVVENLFLGREELTSTRALASADAVILAVAFEAELRDQVVSLIAAGTPTVEIHPLSIGGKGAYRDNDQFNGADPFIPPIPGLRELQMRRRA